MKTIIDYLLVHLGFKKDTLRAELARKNFEQSFITIEDTEEELGNNSLEEEDLTLMLRQAVVKEVERRIENAEAFTAYDITTSVRANGFWARHEEVKEVVHGLWDEDLMIGYGRELKDVGGLIEAWLYSPVGRPGHILPLRIPAPSPDPNVNLTDDSETRGVDGRNTISIPSSMTKRLGLSPGDKVWVRADRNNSQLIVTGNEPDDDDQVVIRYTVDRSNNIRITEKTQTAAGLDTNTFAVSVQSDSIILTAA